MNEIEQIVASALEALAQARHLTLAEKREAVGRIEDMAHAAWYRFMDEDTAADDKRWADLCRKNGWPVTPPEDLIEAKREDRA